jgi:hypothetical protein
VILSTAPVTETTLRIALLYRVFGLIGFLAQVIVAFELRILPTAAAYGRWTRAGSHLPARPMPRRAAAAAGYATPGSQVCRRSRRDSSSTLHLCSARPRGFCVLP